MKYFKPKSLTFWTAFATLTAGIVIATEPIHGMTSLAQSISIGSGMTAPALIALGLGGIGIRAAV